MTVKAEDIRPNLTRSEVSSYRETEGSDAEKTALRRKIEDREEAKRLKRELDNFSDFDEVA